MNHAELVQAATDLLSDTRGAGHWLPLYDAALASPSDRQLVDLVVRLRRELRIMGRLAA
jgi:hypothetical protein